ncbi:hypothetical protein [Hymenobacter cellulosilyticus]|uniref:Uncharacterized protein n=1 Tax=Hymenobacter cellulosilyticus TaxID=2932248 RepID=A0A8T9PZC0_9BACT|nr:hypothetical protein [Hymenobacter cellulosilyticus]UOQ70095.1 hypothetical protein MUN79_15080 [Hymenobacter cellulosilyticus]
MLAGKNKKNKKAKAGRRKKTTSYGYASSFDTADSYSTGYGERPDGTIVGPGPSRPEWRQGGVGD